MTPARTGGIVIVIGSCCAIAGSFLPWIEATDPASGTTLSRTGVDGHYAMLVDLLAVIAAALGAMVLVRRRGSIPLALLLTAMALAQLGIVIFVGSNLSRGVVELEAAGAVAGIGLGLYLTGFGAVVTVAGGVLASLKLQLQQSSA
jgi:hypothetical protein